MEAEKVHDPGKKNPEVICVFDCSEEKEEHIDACSPGNCSPMDPPCMVMGNQFTSTMIAQATTTKSTGGGSLVFGGNYEIIFNWRSFHFN